MPNGTNVGVREFALKLCNVCLDLAGLAGNNKFECANATGKISQALRSSKSYLDAVVFRPASLAEAGDLAGLAAVANGRAAEQEVRKL